MTRDTSVLTRHLHLCFAIRTIIPNKYNCTKGFDYSLELGRTIKNSNVEKKSNLTLQEKKNYIQLNCYLCKDRQDRGHFGDYLK